MSPVVDLQCKRLHPDAKLPAKSGELEAGWDICCVGDEYFYEITDGNTYSTLDRTMGINCLSFGEELNGCRVGDKLLWFYPNTSYLFHTGLACAISDGYCLQLWDRSGMGAKRQIHRLAGIIDSSYRGEILVSLINLSGSIQIIKAGDKIIQGLVTRVIPAVAYWADELSSSYRESKGFGSTGS